MKTIYTDDETENLIKQHRDTNPNFNLSAFVKQSLLNCAKPSMDEDLIKKNIEDSKNWVEKSIREKEFWEKKLEDCVFQKRKEKEDSEKEEKEREIQIEKEEVAVKKQKENILNIFLEITGRDMTIEEYANYIKDNHPDNIWSYAKKCMTEKTKGESAPQDNGETSNTSKSHDDDISKAV